MSSAQYYQALMEVNILNIYVRVKAAVSRKVFKSSPSDHVTVSVALWLRVMCQHIEFLLRNEAFIAPHQRDWASKFSAYVLEIKRLPAVGLKKPQTTGQSQLGDDKTSLTKYSLICPEVWNPGQGDPHPTRQHQHPHPTPGRPGPRSADSSPSRRLVPGPGLRGGPCNNPLQ